MRADPALADPAVRRRRRLLLPLLSLAAVVLAVALAAFQPWKAFVDNRVDEAAPSVTGPSPTTNRSPSEPSVTRSAPATNAPVPVATEPPSTAATAPSTTAPSTVEPAGSAASPSTVASTSTVAAATVVAATAPPAQPPAEPAATSFRSKEHHTTGTVRILTLADGSRLLRIEDLDTSNGPDVKVVLSPDPDGYADGAISLGTLKGNKGSQNYAIPGDVDVAAFRSVVIWCKRFVVDFAVAPLPV